MPARGAVGVGAGRRRVCELQAAAAAGVQAHALGLVVHVVVSCHIVQRFTMVCQRVACFCSRRWGRGAAVCVGGEAVLAPVARLACTATPLERETHTQTGTGTEAGSNGSASKQQLCSC